jgi:hypothetical protein
MRPATPAAAPAAGGGPFAPTSGGPAFGPTSGAPAAPWATTTGAPAAAQPASAGAADPSAPSIPGYADDPSATVVAPWETTGAAPVAASAGFAPTGGAVPLGGATSAYAEDVDGYDDEDDEIEAPRHAYTWLHYLILVAVAFVLGLLIWQLMLQNHGAGPKTASDATTSVALHHSAHTDPEGTL